MVGKVMRIAVDNQISLSVVKSLKKKHDVVLWAGDRQDEVWIDEALALGAEVFISPDLDVPNYLDRINSPATWIDVPQKLPTKNQLAFLLDALARHGRRK